MLPLSQAASVTVLFWAHVSRSGLATRVDGAKVTPHRTLPSWRPGYAVHSTKPQTLTR